MNAFKNVTNWGVGAGVGIQKILTGLCSQIAALLGIEKRIICIAHC